jgi:hypothetical protein
MAAQVEAATLCQSEINLPDGFIRRGPVPIGISCGAVTRAIRANGEGVVG